MKAQGFILNHMPAISFTAETQDDLILLGQMSRCLPYAQHGFTLESKHSLNVFVKDVVEKIVALPEPCEH